MTTELTYLAWALVLAVVQIFLPAVARTRQYGTRWNAGARDEAVAPPNPIAGRLGRAQANLYETLPLFAIAVLIAAVAHRDGSALTLWGARIYVLGRVAYLPLYAFGVPYVRSLVWNVSLVGLLMEIVAILLPTS